MKVPAGDFVKRIILLLLAAIMPMGVFGDANEDLLKAVKNRSAPDVQAALLNKADPFASNRNMGSAMAYAAGNGDLEILRQLARYVKAPTSQQKTALSWALIHAQKTDKDSAEIAHILIRLGADVNYEENNMTPLNSAVSKPGAEQFIKILLEKGAKVNRHNAKGETAIMRAALDGSPSILRMLLKAGADINALNATGGSAIFYAAANNREENVRFLIVKNANINIKNKNGSTPLKVAEMTFGREKIVAMLKRASAGGSLSNFTYESSLPSTPRICLAFDATGALACRDMPGSSCPGNRFWAGPGPCSKFNNKTVQQLSKSDWGSLISAFNGEAADRNKVDEPKQQSKEQRCQKACREQKCGSRLSGEYTASPSAGLRCAGFCDQECSTNPGAYR